MTNADLVARKLATLREHLARIRRRRTATADELRDDVDRLDALSLSLLVVVQEAVDIAYHLASDEGWGAPASHREGFELLARHGVVDGALAAQLAIAAQVRNRIAHGYSTVDVERLWAEIPNGIATFERFAVAIAKHLASSPT
jgi:uncharacterized protein YutE (UPF0331/DUF86 family)